MLSLRAKNCCFLSLPQRYNMLTEFSVNNEVHKKIHS
ncbi:unnamed protein product [Haemonchus placei]|uniref:Uncharacterized protein n=1 Tax=Haemonchus placei TaxID=6290 RepID=A0A3P7XES7_HAEPC|nr:unnamed protein product [Haemonchus placei]